MASISPGVRSSIFCRRLQHACSHRSDHPARPGGIVIPGITITVMVRIPLSPEQRAAGLALGAATSLRQGRPPDDRGGRRGRDLRRDAAQDRNRPHPDAVLRHRRRPGRRRRPFAGRAGRPTSPAVLPSRTTWIWPAPEPAVERGDRTPLPSRQCQRPTPCRCWRSTRTASRPGTRPSRPTVPDWPAFDAARLADHRWVARDARRSRAGLDRDQPDLRRGRSTPAWSSIRSTWPREARGRGIGGLLLRRLIESTEAAGIWTIQSGIFPENTASLALHQRAGFRVVGTRERVAQHHGRWRDVTLIERRSHGGRPLTADPARHRRCACARV